MFEKHDHAIGEHQYFSSWVVMSGPRGKPMIFFTKMKQKKTELGAPPWAKQTVFLLAIFGSCPNEPVVRVPEWTTVDESPVEAEVIWDEGLIHGIKKDDVPLVWPYQESSVAIVKVVLHQDFIFHLCWSRVRQIWSQESLFRIEGVLRGKLCQNVKQKSQFLLY